MGADSGKLPSRQRFVDAAFGRTVDRPPVWLMRQAGRYLPEYREVRRRLKFLELCADVPSAIEVTLQPFRRFAMDGIVLFSDILIPLPAMGIEIRLDDEGPQVPEPVRTVADVVRLHGFDPEEKTTFVLDILRGLKRDVRDEAATIGFCGAPWTLATLRGRRRVVEVVRGDQDADAPRAEGPRGAPREARGRLRRLPRGAGPGGRRRCPDLRHVGRGAFPVRLRSVRAARHRAAHRQAAAARRGPRAIQVE